MDSEEKVLLKKRGIFLFKFIIMILIAIIVAFGASNIVSYVMQNTLK